MGQRLSVVLGEFGCVLRLGLRSVLLERDCLIVAEGARDDRLREAIAGGVDAVLLNLDAPGCAADAERLLAEGHGVRVIGCSADRPAMRVFGPGPEEERPLEPASLVAAIGTGRASSCGR